MCVYKFRGEEGKKRKGLSPGANLQVTYWRLYKYYIKGINKPMEVQAYYVEIWN